MERHVVQTLPSFLLAKMKINTWSMCVVGLLTMMKVFGIRSYLNEKVTHSNKIKIIKILSDHTVRTLIVQNGDRIQKGSLGFMECIWLGS